VAPAEAVVRRPAGLDPEHAAAIPVASLTSLYALEPLAALRPGETLLVHTAAGGVGLAAIAMGRRLGARVFATAGSDFKRRLLLARGVEAVFDSRRPGVGEGLRAATGGRGVDVIVNSVTGELIREGLLALAPGGRFVELGKRDVWPASRVAALRPDVRYFVFDLAEETGRAPAAMRVRLERLLAETASGVLRRPLVRAYAAADAPQAFRAMAEGRHVGKLVLSRRPPAFHGDGAYLVTGGFGGIGLTLARWLAERGAGRIVLMGRRGA